MNATINLPARKGPQSGGGFFFGKRDWLTFAIAAALALAVYIFTLAPGVTMEDSGEFIVAADHMGVPHPPGYPVWTMIAWAFARVFFFVTYRGQPNPAWAVNLVSAVCGALAIGTLAMLIARSGRTMLRTSDPPTSHNGEKEHHRSCSIAAISIALLFALTHAMWSQAVIAEVYSLNALFLALVFLFTYQWACRPTDRLLLATAFVFGLGLANYYALLLIALPLAVIVLLNDTRLFRDFVIAAMPFALLLYLAQFHGITPRAALGLDPVLPIVREMLHPAGTNFQVYLLLNFMILTISWFFLPRGRTVAGAIFMAQLGFAFYIYMPLASDLRNPPMNWGYARTWHGFIHAIAREQYGAFQAADIFSMRFVDQLGDYFADLRMQFSLPVALLGFLPFTAWEFRVGERRLHFFNAAAALCAAGTVLALIEKIGSPPGPQVDTIGLYKAVLAPALLIAVLGVGILVVEQLRSIVRRLLADRKSTPLSLKITLASVPLALLAAYILFAFGLARNIAAATLPLRQANYAFEEGQMSWIVAQSAGMISLLLLPPALFFLIARMTGSHFQLRMALNDKTQRWLLAMLTGFVALSGMIIVMANPKGDVQDLFVQKVKFISSHALFAVWIGYGLILLASALRRCAATRTRLRRVAPWAMALLPLIPLWQNASHRRLIQVYGGAEQNGHDFGWQFGNYSLRGAEAIGEELAPDEEPPPNPEYPLAMADDAIFLGGTDPGRFVPTYMILSARVREDVFLVTQNALVNNTYRNEMRDLYGDRIWIPSELDVHQIVVGYGNDVTEGRERRPPEEHLIIRPGSVQPQNIQGIMLINGLLARAITERNSHRHAVYVEESMPIHWMYSRMEPHGLIMKLHPQPTAIEQTTVNADRDFWDWYTRRLTARNAYLRDFAARRGFSSLRSSLGSLYASRGALHHAEAAFQEARLLHPLSYEAIFRYLQEVLLPLNRFDEARDVLIALHADDPFNKRIMPAMSHVAYRQDLQERIARLEDQRRQGKTLDRRSLLELATLYQSSGQRQSFFALGRILLDTAAAPPVFSERIYLARLYHQIGAIEEAIEALALARQAMPDKPDPRIFSEMVQIYAQAKRHEDVVWAIEQHLRFRPDDYLARLDLALAMTHTQAPPAQIRKTLILAIQHGGDTALTRIAQAPEFAPFVRDLPGRNPDRRRIIPE